MGIIASRLREYFDTKLHKVSLVIDLTAFASIIYIFCLNTYNINPLAVQIWVFSLVASLLILFWIPVRVLYLLIFLVVGPERLGRLSSRILVGKTKEMNPKQIPKSEEYVAAGFWVRFVARAVDSFLVGVVYILLLFVAIFFVKLNKLSYSSVLLIKQVLFVLYSIVFLSIDSTTPGKALFGMKVTDTKGKPITHITAITRSLMSIVSGLVFGVGYLMILSDEEKHRALHDRVAGTLVVRRADASKKKLIVIGIIAIVFMAYSFLALLAAYHIKAPKFY